MPFRTSQFKRILKLLARKRLGTLSAKHPFSRCRPVCGTARRAVRSPRGIAASLETRSVLTSSPRKSSKWRGGKRGGMAGDSSSCRCSRAMRWNSARRSSMGGGEATQKSSARTIKLTRNRRKLDARTLNLIPNVQKLGARTMKTQGSGTQLLSKFYQFNGSGLGSGQGSSHH